MTANTQPAPAADTVNQNLRIWNTVRTPDPTYTKGFTRGGGFSGTAINATYLAMLATSVWGPCGKGWGVEVIEERFQPGAPIVQDGRPVGNEMIHIAKVQLWYMDGEQKCHVTQFGQTTFVGKNRNGAFTDEEAPKKSLTDGMSKCLSLLGFAADVHMGLFDDNKYLNDARQKYADAKMEASTGAAGATAPATTSPAPAAGGDAQEDDDGIPPQVREVLDAKLTALKDVEDTGRIKTAIQMASSIFGNCQPAVDIFVKACQDRLSDLVVPF